MKILIAEDDYIGAKVISKILEPYGKCDVASNGEEAVALFESAIRENSGYALICLDIMMPGMDGQAALKKIREIEERNGIHGNDQARIIMTTALADKENILEAFRSQCEAYVTKPISREKLVDKLKKLELI